MSKKGKFAAYFAGVTACVLLVGSMYGSNGKIYPTEDGADYLKKKDYTVLEHKGADYFNLCGRNVFAREYSVADSNGSVSNKTVCFLPGVQYIAPFN